MCTVRICNASPESQHSTHITSYIVMYVEDIGGYDTMKNKKMCVLILLFYFKEDLLWAFFQF